LSPIKHRTELQFNTLPHGSSM